MAGITGIDISRFTLKNWALIGIIAGLFMFFHLKVRGINNNVDLMMTFVFAVVSLYLVARSREMESANYLHILWNSMAVLFGK